jgi:choline dehydrogenase-like flavoprotein
MVTAPPCTHLVSPAVRDELARRRQESDVDFDAIVVGTGFGGAVTVCRLVEAGFKVCLLERGRRYGAEDFPIFPTEDLFVSDESSATSEASSTPYSPPPDFSRWLWSQDRGLYDVRDLDGTLTVQAAGYGGGSLIYANVHLRPPHDVFDAGWPSPYTGPQLEPYFDLAAYMLGAAPVPQRLAKTMQLQRAATTTPASWFRTPLAINFTNTGPNHHGRHQNPCDMRARCWRGCDRQAKNTLDLNYLARAENGDCDVRTMAEVKTIRPKGQGYEVRYHDLLQRSSPAQRAGDTETESVGGLYVFLCAGAVNTTELLFRSQMSLWRNQAPDVTRIIGSRYSPNADSLTVVFDCDEPHEADYGPTITSAMLYNQEATGELSRLIEFTNGHLLDGRTPTAPPPVGTIVTSSSGGTAILAHKPIDDWGRWTPDDAADGMLVLTCVSGSFNRDDVLSFAIAGTVQATASARSSVSVPREWFLIQEGGYPADIEALVGVFRSPLWLRRNRYLETSSAPRAGGKSKPSRRQTTPLRRPPMGKLRLGAFAEALGGTGAHAFQADGAAPRVFTVSRSIADVQTQGKERELLLPDLLTKQVESIFPPFFVQALKDDRTELLTRAAAIALPMLSRMLDDLSASVASKIDPETRARLSHAQVSNRQVEVLVRGLVRQVLQILAGSEVTLADNAARALLNPIPETPGQLVNLLADVLLWAIGYDTNEGHTALLFTMGRDTYRGRLTWDKQRDEAVATLPARLLDTASVTHERVVREIARAWDGELRTNPGWTTLGQRVTVHSQGGCPMGERGRAVTDSDGEVFGCKGLYVMDAAAFPTSVGVNPSATIAAVAEYKVERFIRTLDPEWRAPDHASAQMWIAQHGRAAIDPLNSGTVTSRPTPSPDINILGLTFEEEVHGFCAPVSPGEWTSTDPTKLEIFLEVKRFLEAESEGIGKGHPPMSIRLKVQVPNLARLVSGGSEFEPVRMPVSGLVTIHPSAVTTYRRNFAVSEDSFLQIFIDPKWPDHQRLFHYHLHYGIGEESYVLDGVKVLCDAPGLDAWHDTSTLYFQRSGPDGFHRGVLRLSIETFVRLQLPSFKITGTSDLARQSWALLAFYKYFAGELADIYTKRLETFQNTLIKLVTSIHV